MNVFVHTFTCKLRSVLINNLCFISHRFTFWPGTGKPTSFLAFHFLLCYNIYIISGLDIRNYGLTHVATGDFFYLRNLLEYVTS